MALVAIKGERTLAELAQQFDVHANQITQSRGQFLEGAAHILDKEHANHGAADIAKIARRSAS